MPRRYLEDQEAADGRWPMADGSSCTVHYVQAREVMLIFALLVFALTFWFGSYVIGRNPHERRLLLVGSGLVTFAVAWALALLAATSASQQGGLAVALLSLARFAAFFPAALWIGSLITLLPNDVSKDTPVAAPERLSRIWCWGLLPLIVLVGATEFAASLVGGDVGRIALIVGYVGKVVVVGALGALTVLVWRRRTKLPRARASAIVLIASLFFALGTGLLVIPLAGLAQAGVLVAVGSDLLVLGGAIVALDALDLGEALIPDLVRSLFASAVVTMVLAGQVALAIALVTGPTLPMLVLFFTVTASSLLLPQGAPALQRLGDRLIFRRRPHLQEESAALRAVQDALPRRRPWSSLAHVPDDEFVRVTRRALSAYGNLARLAASPLTALPQVDAHLARHQIPDNALNRAVTLKVVLTERIVRLKPHGQGDFGTTDEWRLYNALYFPYIAGLKPYQRRQPPAKDLPVDQHMALAWFRDQVPERTLYNWQTIAASVIAQDLRAECSETGSNWQ